MPAIHILSQYIWPDGGPDGILAEQLAARLYEHGYDVRLIGGKGTYRHSGRSKPTVPLLHLDHYRGRRGNLAQTLAQYYAVKRAFARYIDNVVRPGDVVVVTSAPPATVSLASAIKQRGGRAIYWLQDYYPELARTMWEYPRSMRSALCAYWDSYLRRWDRVVKSAGNLGRPLPNEIVIRNWPTLAFNENVAPEPKTVLYSGNLGYAHDVDLLVRACEQLRGAGYKIDIHADGGGVAFLPPWLKAKPLHRHPDKLKRDLLRHEVHLIAAHPKIQHAIFPSKIWNSIAAGRELVCTGFAGEMAEELERALRAPFERHIDQWMELVLSPRDCTEATAAEGLVGARLMSEIV
jgi:colanic acid biosynthesis glycosyl transferase WcaI